MKRAAGRSSDYRLRAQNAFVHCRRSNREVIPFNQFRREEHEILNFNSYSARGVGSIAGDGAAAG
jgi:hypothetical protein